MPRLALLTLIVLAAGLGNNEDEPHLDSSITSRDALAQAGIRLLGNPNEAQQRKGISYFERALADQVRPRDPVRAPVFLDTPAKKTSFRSRPVDDGLSTRRS